MLRIVFFIGLIVMFFSKTKTDSIDKAIEDELKLHPKSQLTDLYKYFFQDAFGPGHLIGSVDGAVAYLKRELEEADSFEEFNAQVLRYKHQFVRVNLKLVAEKKVSQERFISAFIESAKSFSVPSVDSWKKEWQDIVDRISMKNIDLVGFTEDKLRIDSLLNTGDFVVHHSDAYIEAYHPHYRIINSDQWEKLSKELVEE